MILESEEDVLKNLIRYITIIALLFVVCFSFTEKGMAQNRAVTVSLLTFDVTINGHKVDNEYRQYPFFVYKDITYVPMTWYDSRVLGLETTWNRVEGLDIKKAKVTSRYEPYLTDRKNAKSYQAHIRQGTLKLNGKTIENENEDYPFLTFNNITYFPLTWRFAHDEFGWGYEWDTVNGLRITSHNPQVKDSGLPKAAGDNGVAQFKDHFYYVETDGDMNQIYRTSVSNPKNKKKIFEYDSFAYERMSQDVGFRFSDDQLLMNYSIGYSNYYQMISQDGELEQEYRKLSTSLDFRDTPYGKLVVVVGIPDEINGNLHMIKEDGTIQQVGDPDVTSFGNSVLKDGVTPTTIVDDDVYVLYRKGFLKSKLYRINLVTNDTTFILENADWFIIGDNKLYYTNVSDKVLYMANLDGSNATQISDSPVLWFDVIDDNVYYTRQNDTGKQMLYKVTAGKNEQLLDRAVANINIQHEQLFVVLDEAAENRSLILDANGQLQWDLEEQVSKLYASDDGWLIQSARDGRIYMVR